MSSVGRLDSVCTLSRGELLAWVNTEFCLSLQTIEQCANGAVYCQIIDACHPGSVPMKRINWAAKLDHECIPNFKVLQQAFDRCEIVRNIEVDKLVRGKYQDNLEFLQWIKGYHDRMSQNEEYDPLARRFTDNLPEWARPQIGVEHPPAGDSPAPANDNSRRVEHDIDASHCHTKVVRAARNVRDRSGVPREVLFEEVIDLKVTAENLEKERDNYFQRLRDIEIMCQAYCAKPNPHISITKFVDDMRCVLYTVKEDDDDHSAANSSLPGPP
eukprot:TRINITY_DN8396_c0_g1_i1.p1 TRINITY_DN8396_c0_g1~~TRINITY_DN8396_c0_g1_i1.p1  ORF type:complete len:271 (+),score=49.50 TRINITY_DN8396_c0_g1_i1:218-1030(+)